MAFLNFKSRGEGPPIIFIHGFCETSEIWDSFTPKIGPGFQIVVLDLPGFGLSELSAKKNSIETIASQDV